MDLGLQKKTPPVISCAPIIPSEASRVGGQALAQDSRGMVGGQVDRMVLEALLVVLWSLVSPVIRVAQEHSRF